ncbi:MAG: UDP-4-amino-4,6-dideoxy-N-acetyl-beta-L-altrosamine transaminase [Negativicutes bacterium]|nr:UDP-4-amino-4,6-dideoxy-N-acetyl-beta-L-altrosamine transaminase [Negativicutes bacterium]
MKPIPYARQSISATDISAVVEVLQSDWLTQGPHVAQFENAVAEYCGVRYAVAVNSATSALHIACLAAGLGSGDLLWTSPNTFVASANCALYCGADVDFVDIDSNTYNMSTEELERKFAAIANNKGRLPKVVVPVHFSGQSCDMENIAKVARKNGALIIEDAAHAIGGKYQGLPVGSCQYSDMTVFSFHPAKIITTGEGGMVVTNQPELYDRLMRLRTHGITREAENMHGEDHGPWYYQQVDLGFNYRMTDIQAVLGTSQLTRIDDFVARRAALASRYNDSLQDMPIVLPHQSPDVVSAWHLYVIRIRKECSKTRRQIFEQLRQAGIWVNVHYIPVHTQPYYQRLGFKQGDFLASEQHYEEAISLPLYYSLTESEQDYVVKTLHEIMRENVQER